MLAEAWDKEMPGWMKGRSENYLPVRFQTEEDMTNQLLRIRMDKEAGEVVAGSREP